MNIHPVTLKIGLKTPVKLLHISDTHFCLADGEDDPRRRALAVRREKEFGVPTARLLESWCELIRYGRERCDLIVHTGDLIDFVSHANLAMMKERLRDADIFFAVGGHEFIQDLDELIEMGNRGIVGETLPYKMESIEKIRMCSPNALYFDSRVVGGVNLVTLDDSYYTVTRTQLDLLRREVAKGLPIVLCMHGPLHTRALYDEMMDGGRGGSAWLVGTPDELRRGYRPAHCFALQQPDETTFEFIEYVKREPAIKLLLTGHLHRFRVDELAPGKPRILTGLA